MSSVKTAVLNTNVLVFQVKGDIDQNEGRSGTYVVGYYADYELAKKAAHGRGVMGSLGYINPMTHNTATFVNETGQSVTYLLETMVNESHETQDDIRNRALSKLTDDEKKVLGL